MMWGWLKPLLDSVFGWLEKQAKTETKAVDAHTSDETKQRFQGLRDRIRPAANGTDDDGTKLQ